MGWSSPDRIASAFSLTILSAMPRKMINGCIIGSAKRNLECRKDADVIDETPGAYKDIDAVMAAQADLVSIEHTLKQVLCVKG